MPSPTGIWTPEEAATGHVFDYRLAQWMGQYFPKDRPLIDLGCGPGEYLRYFHDIGFEDLHGIEGSDLNFKIGVVRVADLTDNQLAAYKNGNVICLEVAEHIPVEHMPTFLDNVMNHVDKTLILSWGIPGQDGLGHVNCRHNIWVIDYIERHYPPYLLDVEDSLKARAMVSDYAHWLRDTLMIFKR